MNVNNLDRSRVFWMALDGYENTGDAVEFRVSARDVYYMLTDDARFYADEMTAGQFNAFVSYLDEVSSTDDADGYFTPRYFARAFCDAGERDFIAQCLYYTTWSALVQDARTRPGAERGDR